jgi:hypothetical protein
MTSPIRSIKVRSIALAVSAVLVGACSVSEDGGRHGSTCYSVSDCPGGYLCLEGLCARQDFGRDTGNRDVARTGDSDLQNEPDPSIRDLAEETEDVPETSDTVIESEPDTHEDPEAQSDPDLSEDDPAPDECDGRDDGLLGDRCSGADDCCDGLCLGDPESGRGYCTEICEHWDDCNPVGFSGDFFCLDTGGSDRLCVADDYKSACDVPENCIGEICLKGLGTNGCSYQCIHSDDCPPGSSCGLTYFGTGEDTFTLWVCAPVGNSCTIDPDTGFNDCLSGTCLTSDSGGGGFCSVFCDAGFPEACPSGYSCDEIDSEFPPVCVRPE